MNEDIIIIFLVFSYDLWCSVFLLHVKYYLLVIIYLSGWCHSSSPCVVVFSAVSQRVIFH